MIRDISNLKEYITSELIAKGTPEMLVKGALGTAIDNVMSQTLTQEAHLEALNKEKIILNFPVEYAVVDSAINLAFRFVRMNPEYEGSDSLLGERFKRI